MTYLKVPMLTTVLFFGLCSCSEKKKATEDENVVENQIDLTSPEDLLAATEKATGGWTDIINKKDVAYHYEYIVTNGKADISTERYIFNNEISYGSYTRHEINTLPTESGLVTHLFDGERTKVTLNDNPVVDERSVSIAQFVRRANYFWFVMPYKLNDPGTISTYLGKETHEGISYSKIKVTYDPEITGKAENDIYILYINPETFLIDRFYFSLPFLGIKAPVIIAEYNYNKVEGQLLATERNYFLPNAQGAYDAVPSITQKLSQITFNNGFTVGNITE